MQPNTEYLLDILYSARAIWTLCGGALLCLLIDSIWPTKKMPVLVYGVGIASLVAGFVMAFNQWLSPAVISTQDVLVIDRLTLFFTFMVILIGILTLLNALGYLKIHQNLTAEFCSLVLFSIIGMIFLFASDHLIINFIGLETMSLAIYVLVGSHKKNLKSNEAALKYFIMGGVASAILLYGIALFYGAFGTFRLNELAIKVADPSLAYLPKIGLALLLFGLFFKLALVPFHFWAPDVYEGAPAPVTGFMATGVKVAVFGLLIRVLLELNVLQMPQIQKLMAVMVIATFIVGNLVAIVQDDVKRMLAYSSISHAGFLLFGLLAGFKDGVYDAVSSHVVLFYLIGYLFTTIGAFAILSLLTQQKGEATSFSDLRGLGYKHPYLAGAFTLFMLSLMGLPGTVGFIAKYGVISLAVQNGHIGMAVLAVIVSAISAYYYLRPTVVMFFKEEADSDLVPELPLTIYFSISFCTVAVIYLGFKPDSYIQLAQIASSVLR